MSLYMDIKKYPAYYTFWIYGLISSILVYVVLRLFYNQNAFIPIVLERDQNLIEIILDATWIIFPGFIFGIITTLFLYQFFEIKRLYDLKIIIWVITSTIGFIIAIIMANVAPIFDSDGLSNNSLFLIFMLFSGIPISVLMLTQILNFFFIRISWKFQVFLIILGFIVGIISFILGGIIDSYLGLRGPFGEYEGIGYLLSMQGIAIFLIWNTIMTYAFGIAIQRAKNK